MGNRKSLETDPFLGSAEVWSPGTLAAQIPSRLTLHAFESAGGISWLRASHPSVHRWPGAKGAQHEHRQIPHTLPPTIPACRRPL